MRGEMSVSHLFSRQTILPLRDGRRGNITKNTQDDGSVWEYTYDDRPYLPGRMWVVGARRVGRAERCDVNGDPFAPAIG